MALVLPSKQVRRVTAAVVRLAGGRTVLASTIASGLKSTPAGGWS